MTTATWLIQVYSNKLFKFNRHRQLFKVVGREQGLELFEPWSVTVVGEKVVVGSRDPAYLYIFDKNLELDRKVDLAAVGVGDVMRIASNEDDMNLYICNYRGGCVHVLSLEGQGKL